MPRPKNEHPTPAELEVLKLLWEEGPATGREVMEVLNRTKKRAYTSVTSLLNVMAEKGLLNRTPQGRAFLYEAAIEREEALGGMVTDLWQRAFEGSASLLVSHLLEQTNPTDEELKLIREAIESYREDGDDLADRDRKGDPS